MRLSLFGRSFLFQLIQFFCSHTGFGNNVTALGEAIVKGVVGADGDDVANLVPVEISVQGIGKDGVLKIL